MELFTMSTLGSRIKQARGKVSQDTFSNQLQISKGSLGFYERDENLPNTSVILKICSETGVSLEWLMAGRGPMYPGGVTETPCPPQPTPPADVPCERCVRLEAKLDRIEEERREISAENRQLWKENSELKAHCAVLEERQKLAVDPLFEKHLNSRFSESQKE